MSKRRAFKSQTVRHARTCHYCETRIHGPRTWDHIVPLSMGGPNASWNRVTACEPCNRRKANSMWRDHCHRCSFAWHMFELEDRHDTG